MATTEADRISALTRHISGDWGEVCESDKQSNDLVLTDGFRILSAYTSTSLIKFWVITEHDRSATTLLLSEEY